MFLLHDRFIDKGLSLLKRIESEHLPSQEKLIKLLNTHLEIIHEFKDEITFFFKEFDKLPEEKFDIVSDKRDRYEGIFMKVLQEGIADGSFDIENPKISLHFILGASNFMYQWYDPEGDLTIDEISEVYIKFITEGIVKREKEVS